VCGREPDTESSTHLSEYWHCSASGGTTGHQTRACASWSARPRPFPRRSSAQVTRSLLEGAASAGALAARACTQRTFRLEGCVDSVARQLLALSELELGFGKVSRLVLALLACFRHVEWRSGGKREVWASNTRPSLATQLQALLLGSSIPAHSPSATAMSITWVAT
jgi:hypothetical protein